MIAAANGNVAAPVLRKSRRLSIAFDYCTARPAACRIARNLRRHSIVSQRCPQKRAHVPRRAPRFCLYAAMDCVNSCAAQGSLIRKRMSTCCFGGSHRPKTFSDRLGPILSTRVDRKPIYHYTHQAELGLSRITTSFRNAEDFFSPSSADIRLSSCSIERT